MTSSGECIHRHRTNILLYKLQNDFILFFYFQCSFHKCDRSPKNNIDAIEDFIEQYASRIGKRLQCYYDPAFPDYAIVSVVTKSTVIHAMLWPSIACVVAIIILGLSLSEKGQASGLTTSRNNHNSPTFDLRYPGHRVGVEYEIIDS